MELLLSRPFLAGLEHESGSFGRRGYPHQVRAWRRSLLRPPHARIPERVVENMILFEKRHYRTASHVHG
jgi:hypothetical protein